MAAGFSLLSLAGCKNLGHAADATNLPVADLERSIPDWLAEAQVPGLSIAIVHRGKLAWRRGFGVADVRSGTPVTPDTVFAIASCSKAFTAAGVGMMVADGKMSWDDPVRKHVDWFHLSDPSADREVTIRDLLCHRTGMPRHDMLWAGTANPAEYSPLATTVGTSRLRAVKCPVLSESFFSHCQPLSSPYIDRMTS